MKTGTVQLCTNGIASDGWTDVSDFRTEFCTGEGKRE